MYKFRLFSSCSIKLIDGASHVRAKYWLISNFIFFSPFCSISFVYLYCLWDICTTRI